MCGNQRPPCPTEYYQSGLPRLGFGLWLGLGLGLGEGHPSWANFVDFACPAMQVDNSSAKCLRKKSMTNQA